jgi:hypothetical protein
MTNTQTTTKKPRKGALTRQNFFKLKVNKKTKNGCWNWLGAIGGTGTPIVNWEGKVAQPGRAIAYTLKTGVELEPGQVVKATCGNPRCVNPEHSELVWRGTQNVPPTVLKMGKAITSIVKIAHDLSRTALVQAGGLNTNDYAQILQGTFKPSPTKAKRLLSYLEGKEKVIHSLVKNLRKDNSELVGINA